MKFKLSLIVLLILSINLVKCDENDDEFDDGVTVEEENVSQIYVNPKRYISYRISLYLGTSGKSKRRKDRISKSIS